LEDFVRWYSPNDWTPCDKPEESGEYSGDVDSEAQKRGKLSKRMKEAGNLWLTVSHIDFNERFKN